MHESISQTGMPVGTTRRSAHTGSGGSSIVIGCLAGAAGAPTAVHAYENHREQIADFIDNDVRYATNRFISLVSHLLR